MAPQAHRRAFPLLSIAVIAAIAVAALLLLFDASLLAMPDVWAHGITRRLCELFSSDPPSYGLPEAWHPTSVYWTIAALGMEVYCLHLGMVVHATADHQRKKAFFWRIVAIGSVLGLEFHFARAEWDIIWWWISHYTLHPVLLLWLAMGLVRALTSAAIGYGVAHLRQST